MFRSKKINNINDIDPVSLALNASLVPRFDLKGETLPIRIVRYIDGDTIDAICVVEVMKATKTLTLTKKTNILVQLRCRIHGVDAAESKDPRGPEATKFLRHVCSSAGKSLDGKFYGRDCFGRELVELYIENESINSKLLSYTHPQYKHCFQKYDGKKRRKPFPPL
jgi:endonuclease YncB( thermonuclease family)